MVKRRVSKQEAAEALKREVERLTDDDLGKVLEKADELEKKVDSSGPLGRFINDVKLMLSLISDYWHGEYRDIPWFTIASVVGALLYVLNPIDLIPDVIPVFGQVDDAMVVAACLMLVEQDLAAYQEWKQSEDQVWSV